MDHILKLRNDIRRDKCKMNLSMDESSLVEADEGSNLHSRQASLDTVSVTRYKLPNVYKSCPNRISHENDRF